MGITKNLAAGLTIGLSTAGIAAGATLVTVSVLCTAANVTTVAAVAFTSLAVGIGIVSITAWNLTPVDGTAEIYFQHFRNQLGIGAEAVATFIGKAVIAILIGRTIDVVWEKS